MRRLFLLSILAIAFASCDGPIITQKYADAPTLFVVTNIDTKDGMVKMARYEIEVVDANRLSYDHNSSSANLKFWCCDSLGKYKLGQPIKFEKLNK